MADGSLRITFEFEPRHAADAFALFGPRGRAVAIAALKDGHGAVVDEQPVPSSVSNGGWSPVAGNPASAIPSNPGELKPRERLGDLAWRAVQWCKEPEFQKWVAFRCQCIEAAVGEQEAKEFIQLKCGIESRKELDTNAEAAKLFNQHIRGPYQKHLMARGINR